MEHHKNVHKVTMPAPTKKEGNQIAPATARGSINAVVSKLKEYSLEAAASPPQ
jgi:hypothetical protein